MKKGQYCVFEIKNGLGYKKFNNKEICEFAYNAQMLAYKLGAAPKPIEMLDEYTYTTEVADTSFFEKFIPYKDKNNKNIYLNDFFPELHNILKDIMKKNPIKHKKAINQIDMTSRNLGIYENRIVMIDFS